MLYLKTTGSIFLFHPAGEISIYIIRFCYKTTLFKHEIKLKFCLHKELLYIKITMYLVGNNKSAKLNRIALKYL